MKMSTILYFFIYINKQIYKKYIYSVCSNLPFHYCLGDEGRKEEGGRANERGQGMGKKKSEKNDEDEGGARIIIIIIIIIAGAVVKHRHALEGKGMYSTLSP